MIRKANEHTLQVPFTVDQEQIDNAVAAIREQVAAQGISKLTDIMGDVVMDIADGLFAGSDIFLQLQEDVNSLVSEQVEDLTEQYDVYLEAESQTVKASK